MSLADLLSMVRALPVEEQKRLLDILQAELGGYQRPVGDPPPHLREQIIPDGAYPICTPLDCYEAAFVLQRLGNEGKTRQ